MLRASIETLSVPSLRNVFSRWFFALDLASSLIHHLPLSTPPAPVRCARSSVRRMRQCGTSRSRLTCTTRYCKGCDVQLVLPTHLFEYSQTRILQWTSCNRRDRVGVELFDYFLSSLRDTLFLSLFLLGVSNAGLFFFGACGAELDQCLVRCMQRLAPKEPSLPPSSGDAQTSGVGCLQDFAGCKAKLHPGTNAFLLTPLHVRVVLHLPLGRVCRRTRT